MVGGEAGAGEALGDEHGEGLRRRLARWPRETGVAPAGRKGESTTGDPCWCGCLSANRVAAAVQGLRVPTRSRSSLRHKNLFELYIGKVHSK